MIQIGNTVRFILEQRNPATFTYSNVVEVEITRKEFDGEKFGGVGYQKVFIQDTFGNNSSHGIGFNGAGTGLQVESIPFVKPMYRFDFGFLLNSERLKFVYELFLMAYTRRSQGEFVRIRMIDNRLQVSEPYIDVAEPARLGDTIELEGLTQYFLKEVEYLIAWENFTWRHRIGDIYEVDVIGTEVEIEPDAATGTACFPAGTEIAQGGIIGGGTGGWGGATDDEGFVLSEIFLPTAMFSPTEPQINYTIMNNNSTNRYNGHFSNGTDHYFVRWDGTSPGTLGTTFTNYTTEIDARYRGTTGPINSKAFGAHTIFLDANPDNTQYFIRDWDPGANPTGDTIVDGIESEVLRLTWYATATNTLEWQSWKDNYVPAGEAYLIPHTLKTSSTTLTTSGTVRQQFNYGDSPNDTIAFIGDFATNEVGQQLRVVGSPAPLLNAATGFNPIRLTSQNLNEKGGFWYENKIRFLPSTQIIVDIEFSLPNAPGGDGVAIVFQDQGLDAIGRDGSGMGFAANDPVTGIHISAEAITPSLAIAFDTFGNGPIFGEPTGGSTAASQIKLIRDGDLTTNLGSSAAVMAWDGGNRRAARVTLDGLTSTITVLVTPLEGGTPETFVFPGVNLSSIIGTGSCYLGVTAATGGEANPNLWT